MHRWYAHKGSLRYRLLRSGLGIILLIGLLSFGAASYFWSMIETATVIRNATANVLTQRSLARNAEKDFRLSDLLESEFYQGTTTQNLLRTSRFYPHAYRVAVWHSRQTSRRHVRP
jgi:hypothetical protein